MQSGAVMHCASPPKQRTLANKHPQIVPACKPFTITWTPTTYNTVSVLLLKGPSTNVVKFGPSLAEGISNGGKLVWTPAADLEATADATGYGIQIIDDVTGQYQYSTQFGIAKGAAADCVVASSSAVYKASSTAAYKASSSAAGYPVASSVYKASTASPYPTASAINTTAPYPTAKPTTLVYSTGVHGNATVYPTGSLTVPASLRPTASGNATTSALPEATGAASAVQAGLGFVGAAAALAFML